VSRKKAKHKHRPAPASPSELRPRIDRAAGEGRFQQALELAKQLYRYEPTPAHKDLLLKTYLGRARQLRTTGYTRDAVTVINAGLQQDGTDLGWLEQAAQELAACGDVGGALRLLGRLPADSPARGRVMGLAADAAVAQGAGGKPALAPELHADFDRVTQAFAQVQAGQDEPARQALQAIGLRSPFLEWKVLLRGLIAYYQDDDARALDNWQRLAPDRLPARLAAPFRYLIDRPYRDAQAPEAQAALRKQADRLQGDGTVEQLRAVQAALADQNSLTRAFRLAEGLLPLLRQRSPQLAARLAACYYWAVITNGSPDDVPRYCRVFGAPPDDPGFARLRALAFENVHELAEAHKEWQKFEKSVADHPGAWPAGQAQRVRALVWSHMGSNAAAQPDFDNPDLPPFVRNHPGRPRPLKPAAEQCFEHSLKLAPDALETHEKLVDLYRDQRKPQKAEQAARRLLERFPDHVPTIEALADLRMEARDYAEGIALLERAGRLNPLDRTLRRRLNTAHVFRARDHAEAGRFDEARAEYRAALALSEGGDNNSVYCKWAACEFKAGDAARAEELLGQALADVGSRLAVAYSMLIEVIRLRLTKLKKRFNDEFNALLAQPADGASAAAVADTAASHKAAGVTYHGQKTHEKKVLGYLQKALDAPLTEPQADRVCSSLVTLEQHRLLQEYARRGRRLFPANPYFPFYEAESYILMGPYRCPAYQVRELLGEARRLAQDMPPDSRRDALLEVIRRREEMVASVGPFGGGPFGGFPFDAFGEAFFGDDDDGYDDDEW
jgi:tetratricopeptide (TPR) repeat protein